MLVTLATVEFPNDTITKVREPIDTTKYIFLVEAIAHNFRRKFGGKFERIEDTEPYSIASLELIKAAAAYNPDLNKDFSRYAFRAMRNGIIEAIRHRNRQKRTANFSELTNSEWEKVPEKNEVRSMSDFDIHQALENHPEDSEQDCDDKAILIEVYIHGNKLQSVAEKYGVSRMTRSRPDCSILPNQPALSPVAREGSVLSVVVDGSASFKILFN